MARHRQPLELATLKGAVAKDPQHYRHEVPKSDLPLGDAPDHMTPEAAVCWCEISGCAIPGVLTNADRHILEITSNLLAEYRRDPDQFTVGKYAHLIGGFARLGMSPSDRQKVGAEKPKEEAPVFRRVS